MDCIASVIGSHGIYRNVQRYLASLQKMTLYRLKHISIYVDSLESNIVKQRYIRLQTLSSYLNFRADEWALKRKQALRRAYT